MNRKLHHSLTAAMTCSLLLLGIVLISTPLHPAPAPALATHLSTHAPPANSGPGRHQAAARVRQSVRMPFFSFFVPKG